jgi:hypothetical protein
VLRDEPLARPGGTPHVLREAYRRGGRTVYVNRAGRMISEGEWERVARAKRRLWIRRTADPELFARGTVRHPDHATIELRGWHRVLMNTESEAAGGRFMVFLD